MLLPENIDKRTEVDQAWRAYLGHAALCSAPKGQDECPDCKSLHDTYRHALRGYRFVGISDLSQSEHSDQGNRPTIPPSLGTPEIWVPVTLQESDKTVHKMRDGKTKCGKTGRIRQWARTVNCPGCLAE
ncbi:hypothetical protein [Streptomyces sp. 5-10]|uniref:hypothetical protein n=1 Tax=Streptomyces sp. 5-10 TaxID=878925 RepID=UPI00168B97DE|nr:hypothetical protein [Streptomyces sp. 5-10]MBD3005708.1 hypothetical protein [Streptomyces sp. 5-10]